MPFARPGLEDLIQRTDQQVATRLGIGALLRRSILGALSRALAAASHLLHAHLDWIARQVFPDTAETEHLERWGAIWGIGRKAATTFSASVQFSGLEGAAIPSGTTLQRDDGTEYETTADSTIAGGVAEVPIVASETGAASNVPAGAFLSLVSPVAGVEAEAEVLAGELVDGTDQEEDDAYRARILARVREQPHGGAEADYPRWALEVAGVTRAWVFPLHLGAGTVGVTFTRDDDEDGPIPDAAEVDEVQAYLDERRPVTAQVSVFAPVLRPLDLTIELEPDTFALRDAVSAALEDLIRREAGPGATLLVSHVREAISTTPGEIDHVLVELDGEDPPADVVLEDNELGSLGEITWA